MKKELLKTADGSMTIYLPELDEHYHSKHGALQEAQHVFIKMGLEHTIKNNKTAVHILEIGFGTGLNCLLTIGEAIKNKLPINYTAVEAYPVSEQEWKAMEYDTLVSKNIAPILYKKMHELAWETKEKIIDLFSLEKQQIKFQDISAKNEFDLIYFDAFGPRVQPELWTESIFEIMYNALKENGVLVTYSAKGSVRRAMQTVGFTIERLEGPPGKREMLRATKTKQD